MVRLDDRLWLLWAVLILVLPLKWLLCAVLAAAVHELFHIGTVCLLGGRIRGIRIAPLGAVIAAEEISGYREALCALAGPAGSFLMVLLIRRFPVLGLCALVQGSFNLLPVYPMDGGRAVRCLLEAACPLRAVKTAAVIEITVLFGLLAAVVGASVRYSLGWYPTVVCILAILNAILRKRP